MRDIHNGWLIRYIHANGASMFFIVVYSHIFRGLYYGSYMQPREMLWCSGIVIFLLMMATAFMGYVLPWGQMSFWGASVITRLLTVIPFAGNAIVEWFWGGYSIQNPTLKRFFSLHYLMPFIIAALVIIHIALLHKDGSNNPLGIESNIDKIPFYPYFYVKDLFMFMCFTCFFSVILLYYPNLLGHSDNYIPADPLKTPLHIVPEWYFLPFYAILRSIPSKVGGILGMFGSILVLFFLPFINTSKIRSATFRPLYRKIYWFLFFNFLLLGWIGQAKVATPFIEIGQVATFLYFLYFLYLFPKIGTFEEEIINTKIIEN
jgi:ubiquinol-cytochrome c reductase cytochrome b subunit